MIAQGRIRRAGAREVDLIDRDKLLNRVEDRLVNHIVPIYSDEFQSEVLTGNNLGRLLNNVAGRRLAVASDL